MNLQLLSEQDTIDFANNLAPLLQPGQVIALYGELGTGKTFFTRQLVRALGINHDVTSPTYVLQNTYQGNVVVNHLDLYRLEDPMEVLELGLEELFESGITIIEWPEVATDFLPASTLHLYFYHNQEGRVIKGTHPLLAQITTN